MAVNRARLRFDRRLRLCRPLPAPRIAEPEMRQHPQVRRLGTPVMYLEPDRDVVRTRFPVLHENIEVPVLVENARVDQLELRPRTPAPPVLVHQPAIRVLLLRVLVQHLHVAVRRRRVEVVVIFFDVLAVIAFARLHAEVALFEDRVAPVPERRREQQNLVAVADAADRIVAPTIGLAARQIVREEIPGIAPLAVVLANCAPRAV